MRAFIYRGHVAEIEAIRGTWKPWRAIFLDLPEKPHYGWTEHDVKEFVKWTIDQAVTKKEVCE